MGVPSCTSALPNKFDSLLLRLSIASANCDLPNLSRYRIIASSVEAIAPIDSLSSYRSCLPAISSIGASISGAIKLSTGPIALLAPQFLVLSIKLTTAIGIDPFPITIDSHGNIAIQYHRFLDLTSIDPTEIISRICRLVPVQLPVGFAHWCQYNIYQANSHGTSTPGATIS